MISNNDLKKKIIELLSEVNGYEFALFEDLGLFQESVRQNNSLTSKINCLFSIPESEIEPLSNGLYAYAYSVDLDFLMPIDDRADIDGNYPNIQAFKRALALTFQQSLKLEFTGEDGEKYVGGIVYSLPTAGERVYNPIIGDCIAYSANISFAFMANAVNSSDFKIYEGSTEIPYTSLKMSRNPALSVDILKDNKNGVSSAYAENTQFKLDITMPALFGNPFSNACLSYLLGRQDPNESFNIRIKRPVLTTSETENHPDLTTEIKMIISGIETHMSGINNVAYIISLIPYTSQETIGG